MTGRKGRVVRDGRGHGVYELRAKPDSAEMDSLNVREAGAPAGLLAPTWSMSSPAAAEWETMSMSWVVLGAESVTGPVSAHLLA